MFVHTQEKEYYYTKESEERFPYFCPVVLVFHIDESSEEYRRGFSFFSGTILEDWTESVSKEEADKNIDKLFKNNIPHIENR